MGRWKSTTLTPQQIHEKKLEKEYGMLQMQLKHRLMTLQLSAAKSLPSYHNLRQWTSEQYVATHYKPEDVELIRRTARAVNTDGFYICACYVSPVDMHQFAIRGSIGWMPLLPRRWVMAAPPLTEFLKDVGGVEDGFKYINSIMDECFAVASRSMPSLDALKKAMAPLTNLVYPEVVHHRYLSGMPSPLEFRKVIDIVTPLILVDKEEVSTPSDYKLKFLVELKPWDANKLEFFLS